MVRNDSRFVMPNFQNYPLSLNPHITKFVFIAQPKQEAPRINQVGPQGVENLVFGGISYQHFEGIRLVGTNGIKSAFGPFYSDSKMRFFEISSVENSKGNDSDCRGRSMIGDFCKQFDFGILAGRLEAVAFSYSQIWATLGESDFPRYIRTSLRFKSSLFSPVRSPASENQGESGNKQTSYASPKHFSRPYCRLSSGICGFPLSAKIAFTLILSGLATGIFSFVLWESFEGRRNSFDLVLSALLGCGLFALSYVLFAWGSTN